MSVLYLNSNKQRKEWFDDLFQDFFQHDWLAQPNLGASKLNETQDAYTIQIDLPGFNKSEISIEYHANELLIHAQSESRSDVTRKYRLEGIDFKASKATLENGVLTVTLSKSAKLKKQTLSIS